MEWIVSGGQMKTAEKNAFKRGVTLTQNAANACFKEISERLEKSGGVADKTFTFLCGKGGNGSDGLLIADSVRQSGGETLVVFVSDKPPSEGEPLEIYQKYAPSLNTATYTSNEQTVRTALGNSDVIIDCVFGSGFAGELPPKIAELFMFVNRETDAFKISVDLPSGMYSDAGGFAENSFAPDLTLLLGAYKKGLLSHPALNRCGEIELLDIGLADADFTEFSARFTGGNIARCLPKIPRTAHKGDCGRLLNIAGSERYPGAALLSTKAAVKCGAGLVTLAAPRQAAFAVIPAVPEAVLVPLDADKDGFISGTSVKPLVLEMQKATAIAVGCGLGRTPETRKIVEFVIKTASCPVILDADGINSISDNINVLNDNKNLVLTPHPAEFGRLTGATVEEVQQNRIDYAGIFAKESGAVVLLKGAYTVIAAPDGRINVNPTGNAALAKAGTGDVLTGVIASLLARGVKPFEAACLGAYLHGLAADKLSAVKPLTGITAGDVAEMIGEHLL